MRKDPLASELHVNPLTNAVFFNMQHHTTVLTIMDNVTPCTAKNANTNIPGCVKYSPVSNHVSWIEHGQ